MKLNGLLTASVIVATAIGSAAQEAGPLVIVQQNREFSETEVSIDVGAEIRFENQDLVTHSLFSRSPGFEFNIPSQRPGTDEVVRFDEEGTARVECAVHPSMVLTVQVREDE